MYQKLPTANKSFTNLQCTPHCRSLPAQQTESKRQSLQRKTKKKKNMVLDIFQICTHAIQFFTALRNAISGQNQNNSLLHLNLTFKSQRTHRVTITHTRVFPPHAHQFKPFQQHQLVSTEQTESCQHNQFNFGFKYC